MVMNSRRRRVGRVRRGVAVATATALCWLAPAPSASAAVPSAYELIRTVGGPGTRPGQYSSPDGMAFGPDGNLYVLDAMNGRVQVLDSAGRFLRTWSMQGDGAQDVTFAVGLAIDGRGRVYIGDNVGGRVQVYSASGTYIRTIGREETEKSVIYSVADLAISGDRLYVADWVSGAVKKYTLSGRFVRQFLDTSGTVALRFEQLTALTVKPDGTIVVADSGFVFGLDPAGVTKNVRYTRTVNGLATRRDGRVMAAVESGSVYLLSRTLLPVAEIGEPGSSTGQMSDPRGLTLDAVGNLWVADSGNSRLQRWGDATAPVVALRSPADDAVYRTGQIVVADFSCSDASTGIASCRGTVRDGAAIDTSEVGRHRFTVTAVDRTGNTTRVTRRYTVVSP